VRLTNPSMIPTVEQRVARSAFQDFPSNTGPPWLTNDSRRIYIVQHVPFVGVSRKFARMTPSLEFIRGSKIMHDSKIVHQCAWLHKSSILAVLETKISE